MAASRFVLVLAALIALGVIGWGISGVLIGSIRVKSYGFADDGSRRFSREVLRREEPVWFWTICCTYVAVGVAALVAVAMILHVGRPLP